MEVIAHIYNDYSEKFGIPRQSGMVNNRSRIVFTPDYRVDEALRGIDAFSHLWLIWEFSEFTDKQWSPTVRPPRLGGNERVGVFATRSPHRPNPIGLSSVRLIEVAQTDEGKCLIVSGADLKNGTPIYDIKPYLKYTDCHTDASGGFTDDREFEKLTVFDPRGMLRSIDPALVAGLMEVLSLDPRPAYHDDPDRTYGMSYGGYDVKFRVSGDVLTVLRIDDKENP